jgi:SAM-dependent methyltransferase
MSAARAAAEAALEAETVAAEEGCGQWSKLMGVSGETLRPGGLTLTRRALELCAFPPRARIMDVACGLGATLGLLSSLGFAAIGIDSDPAMAAKASTRGPVAISSMEDLPFGDGLADGMFCECALSLASSRIKALKEFHRVLRPGGLLVLSDVVVSAPDPAEMLSASLLGREQPGLYPDWEERAGPEREGESEEPQEASCLSLAITVEENLALLRAAGLTPIVVEDHRMALKALAAALVWAYGKKGLDELSELGAGAADEELAKRLGYALIISENGPGNGK